MKTEKEKALASFKWHDAQRIIFVGCFALGALGLPVIRELGLGVLVAITFSILVMFMYAYLGASKKYLLNPEVLGDNLYYLGFLFTLVSLSYTLYKYSSVANEIDIIIQNFGLGLATTLIGLVGRVYFNQSANDPVLYENAIRMSLAEASANLIGETAKIRTDLMVLKTSIQQSVDEGVEASLKAFANTIVEVTDTAKQKIEDNNKQFGGAVVEISNNLLKTSTNLNDATNDVLSTIASNVSNFNQTSISFILALKELIGKIEKLEPLDATINSKFSEPLERFKNEVNALTISLSEPKDSIESFAGLVNKASISLEDFSKTGLGVLTNQIRATSNSIEDSSTSMKNALTSFKELSENLAIHSQKIPMEFKAFESIYKETAEKIQSAAIESQESLKALQDSLILIAQRIKDSVSDKR